MKVATFCSGIGSPEQALKELNIPHEVVFYSEIDKYARQTYEANHQFGFLIPDMTKCDYEGDQYYADLVIAGLPCQSFSLAGKRLGELDPRGLLFYDFYRYVKNQQPKYFVIENVKGLLSDSDGETFRNWINLLGASENGNPFFFPHEDSLMYNLHWQVLNTKDYGLPQNRERVFLVGIRHDLPGDYVFPKGVPLTKRLKDVLETNVDEKYYLSDKMVQGFISHAERHSEKGNGFKFEPKNVDSIANTITTPFGSRGYNNFIEDQNNIANCITARCFKMGIDDNYIQEEVKIGAMRGRNPENPKSRQSGLPTEQMLEINENGTNNCLTSVQKDNLVIELQIIGYTRDSFGKVTKRHLKNEAGTITTASGGSGNTDQFILEPQLTQVEYYKCCKNGSNTQTRPIEILRLLLKEISEETVKEWRTYVTTSFQKNEILRQGMYEESFCNQSNKDGGNYNKKQSFKSTEIETRRLLRDLWKREKDRCSSQRRKSIKQLFGKLTESLQVLPYKDTSNEVLFDYELQQEAQGIWLLRQALSTIQEVRKCTANSPKRNYRIRRLSVLECFRLQGFPDSFVKPVSDTQLYKQAGNTISVPVIQAILKNLLR